ncbi:MAG: TatD family hydrolase [Bdellovibrionaceae bacterium]|nr:TatD family hydrolase [Pseudobdellovibrionaceae bacterium]
MKWIDSHCHLADPRLDVLRDSWMREAGDCGVDFFMQGGIGPEDWARQKALSDRYPGKIGLCFGLHPYWVVDHSLDECEGALDFLAREAAGNQCLAVGEIGLDLRPHIAKDSEARQVEVFTLQLELAEVLKKPIVLHLVQAYDLCQTIFDQVFDQVFHQRLDQKADHRLHGFVHSFNGSWEQAEKYLQRGLLLSVGGPLCRASSRRLQEVVRRIPLTSLLIETDSPDQPSDRLRGQMNPLASLIEVAKRVAELKQIDLGEVLQSTRDNFVKLMGPK